MSNTGGSSSKNGKRRKSSKSSDGQTNGNTNGNSNGDSLLASLLPYEITKIETITKEYDQAKDGYNERVNRLQQKQTTFKKDYRTENELYKKVKELKGEGLSGTISEESTYLQIKGEFEKFRDLEQALQKYKEEAVNVLFERKQALIQSITDARRNRQVELAKLEHKKKFRADPDNPQPAETPKQPESPTGSSEVIPGSSGVDTSLLEKELFRQNQLERAEKLIDYYTFNQKLLKETHDYYEEQLNKASNVFEGELYNYHVARVQKWISILENRLKLYLDIVNDESVVEQFDKLHDDGYDAPTDIFGFRVVPMINLYKGVHKDKIRKRKPVEPNQTPDTTPNPTPTR